MSNIDRLYALAEERAVVGACLTDPRNCVPMLTVTPDMMHDEHCRHMLAAVMAMHRAGSAIDHQSVARRLADTVGTIGRTDVEAPTFWLRAMIALASEGSRYAIASHQKVVRQRHALRQTYSALHRAMAAVEAVKGDDAAEALSEAVAALGGMHSGSDEPTSIGDAAARAYAQAEKARTTGKQPGIPTNIDGWNKRLGGLKGPRLTVIGARPGMGKSALALQLAMSTAKAGRGVLFASLEMGDTELALRAIASASGVSAQRIDRAQHTPHESAVLMGAVADLEGLPLWIHDRPAQTVAEIEHRARWVASRKPLGLVVVDYLQLAKAAGKHKNREAAVAEVSRDLKGMAKSLNVCVIALAQLNRQCDTRQNRRPTKADLRESGQIEQDADQIAFIYRAHAYEDLRNDPNNPADPSVAELIVEKNRHGTCGTIPMHWDGKTQRFSDGPQARQEAPDQRTFF